jgi:hypothetical protein
MANHQKRLFQNEIRSFREKLERSFTPWREAGCEKQF